MPAEWQCQASLTASEKTRDQVSVIGDLMKHGSSFVWNTLHMFVIIILMMVSFRYLQKAPFVNTEFVPSKTDQFMTSGEQVVLILM